MRSYRSNTIFSMIVSLLLIFAVIGSISIFYKYSDGFESEFKSFYVEVDGETITSEKKGFVLSKYEPFEVNVGYLFSSIDDDKTGYTFTIEPNVDSKTDFYYIVANNKIYFSELRDYSKCFDIELKDDSFTIRPLGPLSSTESYSSLFSSLYDGKSVSCDFQPYEDMFCLKVYSANEKSSVQIYFTLWA
ncbi:MAG: hypothetical protein J6Q32_03175 [Clostridia bacterium]|nr:hypothetical protein [Clostridia bacterium]